VGIRHSWDFGQTWVSLAKASSVFDGAIAIDANGFGFTASGSIAPQLTGWLYRTTNGGGSWTGPWLAPPYPLRDVALVDSGRAFAAGGDTFSKVGGIWATTDGGLTWHAQVQSQEEYRDIEIVGGATPAVLIVGGGELWRLAL
jgi:photosystem II stability/assembly factor-like uncharacterized protein